MVATIVVVVVVVGVVAGVLVYRSRTAHDIESDISSFRRELRALAPRAQDQRPRSNGAPERGSHSGVGILRPDPTRVEGSTAEGQPEGPAGADDGAVDGTTSRDR
jgi:hypothetical protein